VAMGRGQADLARPESCVAAIVAARPDVVINAAAFTAVDRAEDEPDLAQIVNAEAPIAMAEACARTGVRFLHISTDYVFDGSGQAAWKPGDPTAPLGVYGATKLAGERGVQATGAQAVILRTSWVFSAHGANFVKTMLRLGAERDSVNVVGDQIGGPTPAADIAATLLRIAEAPDGPAGIYHYVGAPAVSWADFAREIFAQAGLPTRVQDIPSSAFPTPAKRPANSRLNGDSLLADYGIAPADWRMGLSDALKDLRLQGDWPQIRNNP